MSTRPKEHKNSPDSPKELVLHLYIAGSAPNSRLAVNNIEQICAEYYKGTYELEIIDILEQPDRAMTAGILVTPTLIKLSPAPIVQVVGNLSDRDKVILAIGSKDENHA